MSQRVVHEKRTVEVQVDRRSTYCDCCQLEAPVKHEVKESDWDGANYRHVTFEQDFTGWYHLAPSFDPFKVTTNFFTFCPTCALRIIQTHVAAQASNL